MARNGVMSSRMCEHHRCVCGTILWMEFNRRTVVSGVDDLDFRVGDHRMGRWLREIYDVQMHWSCYKTIKTTKMNPGSGFGCIVLWAVFRLKHISMENCFRLNEQNKNKLIFSYRHAMEFDASHRLSETISGLISDKQISFPTKFETISIIIHKGEFNFSHICSEFIISNILSVDSPALFTTIIPNSRH